MKRASVTVKLQGQRWKVSGIYFARHDGNGIEPGEPARFRVESIEQVSGGDVATLLLQYSEDEIADVALREFEEDLAWTEQAAAETKHDYTREQAA